MTVPHILTLLKTELARKLFLTNLVSKGPP